MDFEKKLICILLGIIVISNFFWWSYSMYLTAKAYDYDYSVTNENTNKNINDKGVN